MTSGMDPPGKITRTQEYTRDGTAPLEAAAPAGEFSGNARFEILQRIGAGGMGVVYRVLDRDRAIPVALKTLQRIDPHNLYRFKREFRALADLQHRNLVTLGELFVEDTGAFFTMELVTGCDFLSYIRPGQLHDPSTTLSPTQLSSRADPSHRTPHEPSAFFDEERLRDALEQLARGVLALHDAGMIHRDLKPSNVMVSDEGRVVILDLGLVAEAEHHKRDAVSNARIVGTAQYMAPEQGALDRVGAPADWYSVGVMLYQALTHTLPFEGEPLSVILKKQLEDSPSPDAVVEGLPSDLVKMCNALLERDPTQRMTGEALLQCLGVGRLGRAHSMSVPSLRAMAHDTATSNCFVGREAELDELQTALQTTLGTDAPVSVWITGESGMGKTALVQRFLHNAAEHHVLCLSGRCFERESVPYKGFDGIIDELSRHLRHMDPVEAALLLPRTRETSALARIFPVLKRVPVITRHLQPQGTTPHPRELRARAFRGLRDLLARLAQHRPLVLVVDDFQWADADSLVLLRELLIGPKSPRLLFIATERLDHLEDPEPRFAADLHLPLEPLEARDAHALIETLCGDATALHPTELEQLSREAGGHPLFLHELARHALGAHEGDSPKPTLRLEDAVLRRVARLEDPARSLLEVLCLAGGPISLDCASEAAHVARSESARWLSELRAAHLVGTGRFKTRELIVPYHSRTSEALLASLPTLRRAELHERLADALEGQGRGEEDGRLLITHLQAAGRPARAAQAAVRAARHAVEGLAFERAASFFKTALHLGTYEPRERHLLLRELGDALSHAGHGAEAAEIYVQALAGAEAHERLECRRLAAEQWLITGHIEQGIDMLRAVLAEVGEKLPKTPRLALASVLYQRARLKLRGMRYQAQPESQVPAHELARIDVLSVVARSLALVDPARGADFQARLLRGALAVGEPKRVGLALALEAAYQARLGPQRLPGCWHLLEDVRRIAEETGDPFVMAYHDICSGITAYFAGRFAQARAQLQVAEDRFSVLPGCTTYELNLARLFRLFAVQRTGALGELREWLEVYLRDASARGDLYAETTMTRAFNGVWLAADAPEVARRELTRKPWMASDTVFHIQHWYELRARVELDLYTRNLDHIEAHRRAFEALEASLITRAQLVRAEVHWLQARMALLEAASSAQPAQALREATRHARRLSYERFDVARTWESLVRACMASIAGKHDESRALFGEACALAEDTEMRLCAEIARWHVGEAQGVAQANRWMHAVGIVAPERFMSVFAITG